MFFFCGQTKKRKKEAEKKMFPNQLPPAVSSLDSTGLTEQQKATLITAWSSFIKSDIYLHAGNIFAQFYEENPQYLKIFEKLSDKSNEPLHTHSLNTLHAMGYLIEFGLHNPAVFDCTLNKITSIHGKIQVSRNDAEKLNIAVKNYILKVMSKHRTQTLEESLTLFFNKIESGFEITFSEAQQEPSQS